jgi:hypothetical protein
MNRALMIILAFAGLSAAQGKETQGRQTFTGVITDSECAMADHRQMQMGPTDAECVNACISAHGASYVLFDGRNVYELSDQTTPKKFAAQNVAVLGTLDSGMHMIEVDSITAVD